MNFMPRFQAEVLSVFRLRTICPCDNLNNCPGYQVGTSEVLCLKRPASTAGVAQSVEHLICNQGVGGSNPFASSRKQVSGNREVLRGNARERRSFKALLQLIFRRV
jgi:hypothetical protein